MTPGSARRRGRCRRSTRRTRAYLRAVDEAVARLRTVEERSAGAPDPRAAAAARRTTALFPRHGRSHRADDRCRTRRRPALSIRAAARWPLSAWCRPSIPAGRNRRAARSPKPGNAHLRRVLVEAAWHYRHRPFVGAALRRRQRGAPAAIIAQAWTAQQRLHRRYHRLAARGKPKQHVITAVARELTGFVWAALIQ